MYRSPASRLVFPRLSRTSDPAPAAVNVRWSQPARHVAAPVALGAAIYLLWRAPHLRMFGWAGAVGADGMVGRLRMMGEGARGAVPDLVLFSLPDALWVYALTAALALVWRARRGPAALAWMSLGPLLGVASELGQLAGAVPGTFDPADVLLGTLAAALAYRLVYLGRPAPASAPTLTPAP